MNKRIKFKLISTAIFLFFIAITSYVFANEPEREEGLSVHALPKRVAEFDRSKSVMWGFVVSQSHDLKLPLQRPTFQTAEDLLTYYFKQSKTIQENGIWLIVTHPDAYSNEENREIEVLKGLCVEKGISLFSCRGSQLPNGWRKEN